MLRSDAFAPDSAVAKEIRKDYGLLMLGIARTEASQGGFHEEVARIAAMYEGPLAVVVARGPSVDLSKEGALNILAPVSGNKVSRRAAEVALAIAKTSKSPMTALYVLGTVGLGAARRRLKRPTTTHHYEEAVLKDIVELAEREGRSIRTTLRLDVSPENVILRQARLGQNNLIVLGGGTSRRRRGKVAAGILENSDCSILHDRLGRTSCLRSPADRNITVNAAEDYGVYRPSVVHTAARSRCTHRKRLDGTWQHCKWQ